ncbi:MAG: hypothetical protein AB1656_15880 [Candidatus Omnitrophota bacterium]
MNEAKGEKMEDILNRIHWTSALAWMLGGFAAAFLLLELILPRGRPGRKGTPESRIYLWTIAVIGLHIAAGLIAGGMEYARWYEGRGPMERFWDWWPTGSIYVCFLLVDLILLQLVFMPAYRRYRTPAERPR